MNQRVVELTQTLVRMQSVNPAYDPASPGTPPVIDYVAEWGAERGFEVERHPVVGGLENLVLRLSNGPGRHLLFNGHFDTVSVAGMEGDPFGAEIRDGKLWGRGACDMKGPIAAMLVAAEHLAEQKDQWRGTLTLGFTPDEEVATAGIRALLGQIARPDAAIVGEPTLLKPLRGCKGGIRFAFRCYGKAAHSSRPEQGRNAVVAMAKAILALNDYFTTELGAVRRPQFGPSTGSIGIVAGGSGINIVPDECTIHVDIRLVPGQDPQETLAHLKAMLQSRFPDGDGYRWSFELLHLDPAFEIAQDHPFTQAVKALTGTEEAEVAFFCCDASKIADIGIPCLILGPGDIAQAHTATEFVALDQLEAGVETYVALARDFFA